MPTARHHNSHPDSGPHGAGEREPPLGDVRPAPRAAPIPSCAGYAPRPLARRPPAGLGAGRPITGVTACEAQQLLWKGLCLGLPLY